VSDLSTATLPSLHNPFDLRLCRSGHSLLNPPKPIDLSNARTASLALNLDLDLDDEEAVAERHLAGEGRRTLVGRSGRGAYEPIFQDDEEAEIGVAGEGISRTSSAAERTKGGDRRPLDVGGQRGREALGEDDEDMWDRLG
jgi:hypothetical protein